MCPRIISKYLSSRLQRVKADPAWCTIYGHGARVRDRFSTLQNAFPAGPLWVRSEIRTQKSHRSLKR